MQFDLLTMVIVNCYTAIIEILHAFIFFALSKAMLHCLHGSQNLNW